MDIKNKIEKSKQKLEKAKQEKTKAETRKEEAEKQLQEVKKEMEEAGVSPETIDDKINELEQDIEKNLDRLETMIPEV